MALRVLPVFLLTIATISSNLAFASRAFENGTQNRSPASSDSDPPAETKNHRLAFVAGKRILAIFTDSRLGRYATEIDRVDQEENTLVVSDFDYRNKYVIPFPTLGRANKAFEDIVEKNLSISLENCVYFVCSEGYLEPRLECGTLTKTPRMNLSDAEKDMYKDARIPGDLYSPLRHESKSCN